MLNIAIRGKTECPRRVSVSLSTGFDSHRLHYCLLLRRRPSIAVSISANVLVQPTGLVQPHRFPPPPPNKRNHCAGWRSEKRGTGLCSGKGEFCLPTKLQVPRTNISRVRTRYLIGVLDAFGSFARAEGDLRQCEADAHQNAALKARLMPSSLIVMPTTSSWPGCVEGLGNSDGKVSPARVPFPCA